MVIIDTSVVFKWFSEEVYRDNAEKILEKHLKKLDQIYIPDLLYYEITNAWATKTSLSIEDIKQNLSYLKTYRLFTIHMDFVHYNKAAEYAKKYHVSVYDSVYAVLAEEKNCLLFTTDTRFLESVSLPFVKHLREYR